MIHFKKIIFLIASLFICMDLYAASINIPPSQILENGLSAEQLRQAADAGDPDAQYALGYMYFTGKNVPADRQTALSWIKRASVQGQEQAVEAMRLMGSSKGGSLKATAPKSPSESELTALENSADENKEAALELDEQSTHPPARSSPPKATPAKRAVSAAKANVTAPAILKAPLQHYTIQLLASSNKDALENYINAHGLEGKAKYYMTKKQKYVLLYGVYKTRLEAQNSLSKLPADIKAVRPWVKQVGQVKEGVVG